MSTGEGVGGGVGDAAEVGGVVGVCDDSGEAVGCDVPHAAAIAANATRAISRVWRLETLLDTGPPGKLWVARKPAASR